MRGLINDCLRRLIGCGIVTLGLVLTVMHWFKIISFGHNQKRLRRRYRITAETPVLSYGPELEQLIQEAATQAGHHVNFAMTSGSTGHPKRSLYTRLRLFSLKFAYTDVFARCCWSFHINHTSLYVFSSLSKDDSLTAMLLDETKLPSHLSTLQAPYRVQAHPSLQALASRYGTTALRLWILVIANPGFLYSTNPSTISTFLDEVSTDWEQSSKLIKDWYEKPDAFDQTVQAISGRLQSRGSATRLARIAMSETPLGLEVCAPAVKTYMCWTGGYVKPFLDRVSRYLAAERYRLIPMYSMSTETIETISHFQGDSIAFLPLGTRVLYEFVEDTAVDKVASLLSADQLEIGKTYSMVVSDQYGLRRYQTADVFLCRGMVAGLPDLSFIRRRGLSYSFTGEKLTAEHVSMVFQGLRKEFPLLDGETFLTCVPSQPANDPIPHYKVLLIPAAGEAFAGCLDQLALRCDELLAEINCEYKNKRDSGRLGRVRLMHVSRRDFIAEISGGSRESWETQFKFLPLYQRQWEPLQNAER